jgi:hypothetical protein
MVLGLIMVLIGQNYSIKTSPGLINIIGNPAMIVSGSYINNSLEL